MPLDDYTSGRSGAQQKQTHITIENPDHEDTTVDDDMADLVGDHFEAANTVKASQVDRTLLTGDFMVALAEYVDNDHEIGLYEFFLDLVDEEQLFGYVADNYEGVSYNPEAAEEAPVEADE